ncbi:hypothetical protein C478_01385 [Natrinema thermotolerans DSM 11552]|uniref:hypothetical protein n=1 Tax=Natrinema sp. H-ect1 TaxID=3242700 RepID=UPI0002AFF164|nr:hypothetical protein C478_01385 [Natrinema thermotolerans DSM 11552]
MAVTVVILLVVSLAIPLVLWLAISRETSDPTVVDRREAERIAKERGGREPSRSAGEPDRLADDRHGSTRSDRDERDDGSRGFGTRHDDR